MSSSGVSASIADQEIPQHIESSLDPTQTVAEISGLVIQTITESSELVIHMVTESSELVIHMVAEISDLAVHMVAEISVLVIRMVTEISDLVIHTGRGNPVTRRARNGWIGPGRGIPK